MLTVVTSEVAVVVAVAVVVVVPTWPCSMTANEAKNMVNRTKMLNIMFFVFIAMPNPRMITYALG